MDNHSGMIAAIKPNDAILLSILTIVYASDDREVIEKFLMHKNRNGESILTIVNVQESDLSIHYELLSKMEKRFLCDSDESLDPYLWDNINPTLITSINDDTYLCNVLKLCNWKEYSGGSKKKIFHYICDMNFNKSLHFIKKVTSFQQFLELILSIGKCQTILLINLQ